MAFDPTRLDIGRKDLAGIREQFMRVGRMRLQLIQDELKPAQRQFLTLLPLLVHVNHPLLPGFVSKQITPCGLPDYQPGRETLLAARGISRNFDYKPAGAVDKSLLRGLYAMGSSGTLGHSQDSDLDIWLCHCEGFSAEQLSELGEKTHKLEQWAADLGLEAHIFLVNIDGFRRGQVGQLSHESSGSTQHVLLLEEFYRSSLLLAGAPPFWWLVPPEHEKDYDAYMTSLIQRRIVASSDYIDFGGLGSMPEDEFLGAAHWQLHKGVDAPYKSLLKLLLLEHYAQQYPDPLWLATQIKRSVYQRHQAEETYDAYIRLYQNLQDYLLRRGQHQRLELVRRCLYFKAGIPLSRARAAAGWRAMVLRRLTREWGWSQRDLAWLDQRPRWGIEAVKDERNLLVAELSRGYRFLTDFVRRPGASLDGRIDAEHLNQLGRKLYAELGQRPGKIDWINPGISEHLGESHLTLHYLERPGAKPVWRLYRGRVSAAHELPREPIKVAAGFLELLVWARMNGLIDESSTLWRYGDCPLSDQLLRELRRLLHEGMDAKRRSYGDLAQFRKPAHSERMILFVNLTSDPAAVLLGQDRQLTSNRSDMLSFSSAHRNLVGSLHLVEFNSWGEVLVSAFENDDVLPQLLCQKLNQPHSLSARPSLACHCFTPVYGRQIELRLQHLLDEFTRVFADGRRHGFLFEIGDSLVLLTPGDEGFGWRAIKGRKALLDELSRLKVPLALDAFVLQQDPLREVLAQQQPGQMQCFFCELRGRMQVYVADPEGGLFVQTLETRSLDHAFNQYRRFLNSMLVNNSILAEAPGGWFSEPLFYRLLADADGAGWSACPLYPQQDDLDVGYHELRLVADYTDLDLANFTLFSDGHAFSPMELGDSWASAVVAHVQSLRRNRGNYPVYLTAVELNQYGQGDRMPSAIAILRLKEQIEKRLNRLLN
jgi:adenylate cyclase class 1